MPRPCPYIRDVVDHLQVHDGAVRTYEVRSAPGLPDEVVAQLHTAEANSKYSRGIVENLRLDVCTKLCHERVHDFFRLGRAVGGVEFDFLRHRWGFVTDTDRLQFVCST